MAKFTTRPKTIGKGSSETQRNEQQQLKFQSTLEQHPNDTRTTQEQHKNSARHSKTRNSERTKEKRSKNPREQNRLEGDNHGHTQNLDCT